MPRHTPAPLLAALEAALDAPIRTLDDLPAALQRLARHALEHQAAAVASFTADGQRYLASRAVHDRSAILVLGPYRRHDDPPTGTPVLDAAAEARARRALELAVHDLSQVAVAERQRRALASQLELISSAAIAITAERDVETVLHRIVDLAREVVGARYAALGIKDEHGAALRFLFSGMSAEEQARFAEDPHGRGLPALLLREGKTIRLADLRSHPASVGFPEGHPEMRSFLGVPVTSRGRILGNLYLTDKETAGEFTDEDVRLVELLARYAGVAIENAGLYQRAEGQQARLQAIIDQLPEAILLLEPDPDRVTLVNTQAARLLGWEIHPPIPLDAFLEANARYQADEVPLAPSDVPVVRALRYGETTRREVRIQRPDGATITTLVNAAPLRDPNGRITAAIAVFQDITALKDAEQLKDDFLALVSHELRTPMTTIQGGALLLLQSGEQLDAETRRMILTDIAGESRRLAGLVENMVQLANIRAGRFGLDSEPIHVRTLIERAVAALRDSAPQHTFEVGVEPDLLALGDPSRIDQVIHNVLHNAIKYAPGATPIEIRAARDNGMVVISVRDHGPGIDEDDLPFVFSRFERGRQVVLRHTSGLGLGLYLAKHLIEAHGGQIWIERPPDGGTCIHFTIPAITDDR